MKRTVRLILALGCLGLATSCDDWVERRPRVTPAAETLWLLVELQLKLDALKPFLVALDGRSFSPKLVDRLTGEVAQAAEELTSGPDAPDRLRAARYRADLVGVGYDLLGLDAEAAARGFSGAVRGSCNAGIQSIWFALAKVDVDTLWPVKSPEEADSKLLGAVQHRDNALRAAPIANVMKAGVQAASITTGALSAAQLTRSGLSILTRLATFARSGGGAPAMLEASFAGGVGGMRVVTAGKSTVLSVEEVVGLAQAGIISAMALNVFLAASQNHHICTDKNRLSEHTGGPWTPICERLFKRAGMDLDDPANLVKVAGHRGRHPRAYHEAIVEYLEDAVEEISPHTPEYQAALKKALGELAAEIRTPGTRLNRLITGVLAE